MKVEQRVEEGRLVLRTGLGDRLSMSATQWGHPDVRYNDNRIPSARMWGIVANYLCEGKSTPRDLLIKEARRAEIYRLVDEHMLVWTQYPRKGDEELAHNIYKREEGQRVRTLVDAFDVTICKIEANEDQADAIREMLDFCNSVGLKPFAAGEERIMVSSDVERIFDAFGTDDWVRLYVYFKRPSASHVHLDLTDM